MMKFKLLHFEINKILLFSLLGILIMCSAASANVPITDGLVAEYDFQEGVDPATLYDISGNGHDGTIYNAVVWTDYGITLNGVNNSIDVGDLGNLSDGFTFVAATRCDNNAGGRRVLFSRINSTSGTNANGTGFLIEKMNLNNEWETLMYHGDSETLLSSRVVGDGYRWQIVSSRYDATSLNFVTSVGIRNSNIDYGKTSVSGKMRDHTGKYVIGRPSYTGRYYYDGEIGYMVIYNRTLSDSELKETQLYVQSTMENRGIEMPKSISTPYIILTLDDGYLSDYDNANRIASAKNVPLTSYIITNIVGDENRLTWSHIKEMRNRGMGVESHTHTHIPLAATDNESIITNLENVNNAFISNGLPQPEHISYPFGDDDARSREVVSQIYTSGRDIRATSARDMISEDYFDLYGYQMRATGIYIPSGSNADDTCTLIDNAIASNTSLFLYTHDVNDNPSSIGCNNEAFEQVINHIAEKRDAGLIIPITHDGFYRAFQGIRTVGYTGNTLTGQTTEITDDKTVDQVGFVWGTTRLNNPEGLTPAKSGYDHFWVSDNGDYSSQIFSHSIIKPSGKFYYRSAANVNGTWVYGEELTYSPSVNYPYYTNGISYKVDKNGYHYGYSTLQAGVTKIPLVISPETDTINVAVNSWSTDQKVWTESSNISQSVTHIVGELPSNANIQIYRDGSLYDTVTSNATGYITWVYEGGFSEHTFSIESPDFYATSTNGYPPLTVKFAAHGDDILKYYWDFENDGIIDSTNTNPIHTYGQAGDYSVKLTVEKAGGNISIVKPNYITITPPAFSNDPIAWFNWVFRYISSIFVGAQVVS